MFNYLIVICLISLVQLKSIDGISNSNNNDNNQFKLVILHTNDMHARFAETSQMSGTCTKQDKSQNKCYGGFARVAHIIREVKYNASHYNNNLNVMVLDAGDTFTGTPYFTVFGAAIATEFVNYLDFDVMALGNHEFDLNVTNLIPYINDVHSPIVCANIDTTDVRELRYSKLKRSTVRVINGRKIGVIGYLTADTAFLSKADNVIFLDEVESINRESEFLTANGVDIIIALGHSGFEIDKRIAKNCPLVDVVIGGHTNTFLYTGKPPDIEQPVGPYPIIIEQASGKKVPVVQAYAFTKYIGQLFLTFDAKGNVIEAHGNPILLGPDIPQAVDILDGLKKYQPRIDALTSRVLGKTLVFLNSSCTHQECNLGNLVADAMVYNHAKQYRGKFWTDAAIAILNRGNIRAPIGAPIVKTNISLTDVLTAIPFGNSINSVNITGSELLQVLKHSASRLDKNGLGFLQVSGLHIVYDMKNGVNNPEISVRVRCSECSVPVYEDLKLNRTYSIVLSSYLTAGGDGYDLFKSKVKGSDNIIDAYAVANYIEQFSPLIIGTEERIKVINLKRSDQVQTGKSNRAGSIVKYNLWSLTFLILSVIKLVSY